LFLLRYFTKIFIIYSPCHIINSVLLSPHQHYQGDNQMKKIVTTIMLAMALFMGVNTFQARDSKAGVIIMAMAHRQNVPAAFYVIGSITAATGIVGSVFVIKAVTEGITYASTNGGILAAAVISGALVVADASGSLENNSLENALRTEIPEVSEPAMIRDLAAALKAEANGKTTDAEGKLFVKLGKDQVRDILSNSAQLDAATIEIVADRLSN
jgi:hypothetical protein